jgi:ParB family chromosome partitioning protein
VSKGLGRGLDALIPSLHVDENDQIVEIPMGELRANPYQPRKHFEQVALEELAQSIQEHGVIQPIIVRKVLKGYEIIAGERRWRASTLCKKETIPAVIRSLTDRQVMEVALIENVQRADLNALEISTAYHHIMETFALTQEQLAVRVGKSRSHVANMLRLLRLPEGLKQHVSRGTLTMGHVRAIVGMKEDDEMIALGEAAVAGQWSVRQLEKAVTEKERRLPTRPAGGGMTKSPHMQAIEERLRQQLQARVQIQTQGQAERGKIEITYQSAEQLQRIVDRMLRE